MLMQSHENTIRQFYAQYLSAFHTLEASAVVPFYATPSLFVSEDTVVAMNSATDIERLFVQVIAGLKSRNYDHSEVPNLKVNILSDRLAEVGGLAIRYSASGAELERSGANYILRRLGHSWKFVSAVAYPSARLKD